MWIFTGNKLAKFYRNILSLSENIGKSFRGGATFLTHTVYGLTVVGGLEYHDDYDDSDQIVFVSYLESACYSLKK